MNNEQKRGKSLIAINDTHSSIARIHDKGTSLEEQGIEITRHQPLKYMGQYWREYRI
jgi:hypothetical protein